MSFSDFPEQQQVVQLLQRSLERQRLAHGYLFSGNEIGELEAMALTLAKTLNCQNPKRRNEAAVDSCDQCDSCKRINEQNHPDILSVRPESKSRIITIDQMRELMQTVNLKPTIAPFKVAVIVSAERLNVQAANAFLKTLEEPPSRSILILLTTEPQQILETIISRCLRLNFSGERKPQPELVAWVKSFAEMTQKNKSGLLGRYQLLGVLATKLSERKTQIEEVLSQKSPLARYDDLDPKMRDKLEDELNAAVESEYRRERGDLLLALQLWLRDVWLATMNSPENLFSFPDLKSTSSTVGERISTAHALENLTVMEQTQRLLMTNIQEALALEVGLLKLKL